MVKLNSNKGEKRELKNKETTPRPLNLNKEYKEIKNTKGGKGKNKR